MRETKEKYKQIKRKNVSYFTSAILSLIFYLAKIIFLLCLKSSSNVGGSTSITDSCVNDM